MKQWGDLSKYVGSISWLLRSLPATTVEKGMLSDQARNGLDTGQSHLPVSLEPRASIFSGEPSAGRSSLLAGTGSGTQTSSIPPLEYKQTPASTTVNGSLSFAEQRRLEEYGTGFVSLLCGIQI